MSRNFGLTGINTDNLSNRTVIDGGFNSPSGSHGAHAIQSHAENIIQFPRPVSSLGSAANSRAQQREFFIQVCEIAGRLLFFGLFALSWLFVGLVYLLYRALVT